MFGWLDSIVNALISPTNLSDLPLQNSITSFEVDNGGQSQDVVGGSHGLYGDDHGLTNDMGIFHNPFDGTDGSGF